MARLLLVYPIHNLPFSSMPITTLFLAVLAVLCILSFTTFLCGSRNMKKLHTETGQKENKHMSKLNSNLSSRALSMVKMISWRKVQAEGEEEEGGYNDQDEEALWRKNILMGEKCRPLDFSGKIVSDSQGKNAS